MTKRAKHFYEAELQALAQLEDEYPNQAAFPSFRVSTIASFAGVSDLRAVKHGLLDLKRDELVMENGENNWRISAKGRMLLEMDEDRAEQFRGYLEATRR